jgi:outer membrane protein assembly factor BamB
MLIPPTIRPWSYIGLLGLIFAAGPAAAELSRGLISEPQAASVGLKRAWFARAEMNPARSSVVDWILSYDVLLILTDAGVMHALDADTGKTLWYTEIGNSNHPSLGPAANEELVAVINGSTLYLLDRADGSILSQRRIGGAPGAAPALSKDFVFVPTINGLIEGYPLDPNAPVGTRWFYQSFGRALVPPLITPTSLVWTTDAGFLYVSRTEDPGVEFRLETKGKFDARPAYRAPLICAVSLDGEVFAIDEKSGALQWRYLTGYPTDRAPAVVGDRLFVSSEEPTLHCVDVATGLGQWEAREISQFAAATKSHVYGVDRYGTIHILNIADGATVGRIPTGGTLTALVNDQTDRLFLISESGLVQCLHEIGADEPTHYVVPSVPASDGEAPAATREYRGEGEPPSGPTREPAEATALPSQDEDPFDQPADGQDGGDPFGAPADEAATPAEDSNFGVEENPFE